jgi:hypothetical protein
VALSSAVVGDPCERLDRPREHETRQAPGRLAQRRRRSQRPAHPAKGGAENDDYDRTARPAMSEKQERREAA